mmetsp:Transcript_55815/g.167286  ORF Transcript_55815/g.167286 Transcript_55815/m.167286 type:complete len:455 (-) Transcript_55815:312-1676(-)
MQHDEMIWSIVNNQFCSYKTTIGGAKSEKRDFCRHPYSVTGLCNRSSCPLANSRYATVREEGGKVSLFVKTVERAHSPKNLWERIQLSRNYAKALVQLDEHLQYFPKAQIHRNKQRLTKIHQYLLRMRKIKLKELAGKRQSMVGINRKVEQREGRREKKALVAAKVEKNIEKELVERLARGTYGDIYNFPRRRTERRWRRPRERRRKRRRWRARARRKRRWRASWSTWRTWRRTTTRRARRRRTRRRWSTWATISGDVPLGAAVTTNRRRNPNRNPARKRRRAEATTRKIPDPTTMAGVAPDPTRTRRRGERGRRSCPRRRKRRGALESRSSTRRSGKIRIRRPRWRPGAAGGTRWQGWLGRGHERVPESREACRDVTYFLLKCCHAYSAKMLLGLPGGSTCLWASSPYVCLLQARLHSYTTHIFPLVSDYPFCFHTSKYCSNIRFVALWYYLV